MKVVNLDRIYYSEYFYQILMREKSLDSGSYINEWLNHQVRLSDLYKWCRENITNYWSFEISNSSTVQVHLDRFCFLFETTEDAMAFKLRWS